MTALLRHHLRITFSDGVNASMNAGGREALRVLMSGGRLGRSRRSTDRHKSADRDVEHENSSPTCTCLGEHLAHLRELVGNVLASGPAASGCRSRRSMWERAPLRTWNKITARARALLDPQA